MKKSIFLSMTLILLLVTGCMNKTKTLVCTKDIGTSSIDMTQSINIKFIDDKVEDMTTTINVNLPDNYKSSPHPSRGPKRNWHQKETFSPYKAISQTPLPSFRVPLSMFLPNALFHSNGVTFLSPVSASAGSHYKDTLFC